MSNTNNNNYPSPAQHHYYHSTTQSTKKHRNTLSVLSQRAVLSSKHKLWDSNVVGMDAAESAVEVAYNLLRDALLTSVHVGQSVYGAAKSTTEGINHSLLLPIKEFVLLPTFGGIEQVWCALGDTEQLPYGLDLVRSVPWMGEPLLAPLLLQWWSLCQSAVHLLTHHGSLSFNKQAVRENVDAFLTVSKTFLHKTSVAIQIYVKRLDANVTRTLMHTQWKVLGSGPYATLDERNKLEVLDHVCERYLQRETDLARYELAAHIRAHNPRLYQDLIVSGLLQSRLASGNQHDEWLEAQPLYYGDYFLDENDSSEADAPYLIYANSNNNNSNNSNTTKEEEEPLRRGSSSSKKTSTRAVVPLMFRLPYINGERPKPDAPWQRVNELDRRPLEEKYLEIVASAIQQDVLDTSTCSTDETDLDGSSHSLVRSLSNNALTTLDTSKHSHTSSASSSSSSTMAKWYEPDMENDVLMDEKRHAVSFITDANGRTKMMVRPTLWRFHGVATAEICRAVWFVDTNRHGLQPYSEDAAAILEDAYLFLKWRQQNSNSNSSTVSTVSSLVKQQKTKKKKKKNSNNENDDEDSDEETSVLTVQVLSPDGSEQQLVQFSSLTQVTAISKTLGGAISLFKRRVYRGVLMEDDDVKAKESKSSSNNNNNNKSSPPRSPMSTTSLTTIPENDDDGDAWLDCLSIDDASPKDTPSHHLLALPPTDLHLEDEYQKQLQYSNETTMDHLVLVVHGIGEMLRSTEVFGHQTPTIVDCCGALRRNHTQVSSSRSLKSLVEYIPVEWHEAFCAQRTQGMANVNDISLPTIPTMRHFANDVLMDVLYFMSPQYHDLIIRIVTQEMNLVVEKFQKLYGILPKVSIIGHSLGAIIAWDILDHQEAEHEEEEDDDEEEESGVFVQKDDNYPEVSPEPGQPPSSPLSQHSSSAVPQNAYPQLAFCTENVFFLGAPIAVFLMIRNQNNPNDNHNNIPTTQPHNNIHPSFCFKGCPNVFNIFHPYDPVAYRMEPLIHRSLAQVEPMIIKHCNSESGYRVHYQTKRIWLKFVEESQDAVVHIVESKLQQFGLVDSSDLLLTQENSSHTVSFGRLNQGRRIDYMLQEHEIENANEYVAALAAHSSYW
eukprot:CAMPEP_0178924050 /NCGR_PEP_ID=MMETSP0786-20121207/17103_1 /TAXON_ID=186022 /ORGANISM="Thalassionema frauenfeldii, Strain CCMP 1798" /LENGTH=1114 /DNA_ID=CAMNT_0020598701 /DNA_START=263 /DNA_END=3604 /DNA_ORIENTATION=-